MERRIRRTGFLRLVLFVGLLGSVNSILAEILVSNQNVISYQAFTTPDLLTTLAFEGLYTFSGDVLFTASTNSKLAINIGRSNPTNSVVFEPILGTADTGPSFAHIIFAPEENGVIEVNLYSDLTLTGSNVDEAMLNANTNPLDISNTELTVTFRGKGTTVFNMRNGKKLVVTSLVGAANGGLVETNVPTTLTDRKPTGVAMYVTMDQSKQEVVTHGLNKVIFRRSDVLHGGNADVEFQIGLNSFLTFISANYTGLDSTNENTTVPDDLSGVGTGLQSYAAIAFDVSNFDKGSMIFNVKGAPVMYQSYTDGAFTLAGQYLQNSTNNATARPGDYTNNDHIRNCVNFGQRAGCVAYLRVIDNAAYFYDKNATNSTVHYIDSLVHHDGSEVGVLSIDAQSPPIHTRRGLHIRCSNKSFAPLATNPYGDSAWNTKEIFASGRGNHSVQPGFTVGINGHIEVNHNTFLDYTAEAANVTFQPAIIGMSTLDSLVAAHSGNNVTVESLFKEHNPSAMLIDGLGSAIVNNQEQIKFLAHLNTSLYRSAELTLYGNGSATIRAPLLPIAGDYDGFRLSATGETLGDGIFVLDIEGPLVVRSLADTSGTAYDYEHGLHTGSAYPEAGTLRLGSLQRSIDDREITKIPVDITDQTPYVQRPLAIQNGVYTRYDRATVLINDKVDFVDIKYHHDDVSRYIKPNVNESPPVFCGGERAHFLNTIFGFEKPDVAFLRIYNTEIHCHESMCISGVRIVVRELPDILSLTGGVTSNKSAIILYNHGYALDTNLKGFGRIFLMGSKLNKTASGDTSSFLENSYFNIFRHSGQSPFLSTNTLADPINGLKSTLALETAAEIPLNTSLNEKAIQMFYLGNNSNVEIGWVSEVGLYRGDDDVTIFPWDHRASASVTSSTNKFNLQSDQDNPGTLSFAGDFIYLGGSGPNGETSPRLVSGFDMGRVIYVGHGGKIEITEDLSNPALPRPYVGFSDATIAIRLWKSSSPYLSAQINLPYDQMILRNPIRPYNLDMSLLTDATDNKYLRLTTLTGQGLGTAVSVAWNAISKPSGITATLGTDDFSLRNPLFQNFFETKAVNRTTNPIPMPEGGLLQMSTGDYLDQLSVSGATLADPFLLYLSGNQAGISQIREIVTEFSETPVPGEGSFAKIFMDQGARLGLGSRNWNEKSVNSWNLIGRHFVSLVPNGDCQIDVNSDIVVADAQPIIPTTNFGKTDLINQPSHRITFFSHDTREIRVPAGHELDLSAFGQSDTDQTGTQQIAFGGMLRLIFEPGSTLRFPTLDGLNVSKQPILYLNEKSQLIFEAIQDMNNKFVGNPADKIRWQSLQDSNRAKTRILGVGQIWINKTATMSINDNAIVAIEADAATPKTNITISLQREGLLELGDPNILGGSLQIGNSIFNPDGSFTDIPGAEVNFTLRLGSPDCKVYLGRNAFLGFGVGVVDRFEEVLNSRWRIQPLKYVKNIGLKIVQGVLSHNQIYDGTSKESSLMAIGPTLSGGNFKIEVGPSEATILGGGNLLYVGDIRPTSTENAITVNILNQAVSLVNNEATDTGKYTILNPSIILGRISDIAGKDATSSLNFVSLDTTTTTTTTTGSVSFSEKGLNGGFGFSGSSKDAYRYLGFRDFNIQEGQKYLALGKSMFENRLGYVIGQNIIRTTNLSLDAGISSADVDKVKIGALQAATTNRDGAPVKNKLPE